MQSPTKRICLKLLLNAIHHLLYLLMTSGAHHILITSSTLSFVVQSQRLLDEVKGPAFWHHYTILASHNFLKFLLLS